MASPHAVAMLIGSLRRDSFCRKVGLALCELASPALALEIIDIAALTFYNQDLESAPPVGWTEFRERIRPADALLIVTPEYNRGVPGVLKNAIDVGSRPRQHSVWNGKPGAVVSASPGALGGFAANQHLRQSLTVLNVPLMPRPELYLGEVDKLFDADGRLTSEAGRQLLVSFIESFRAWITLFRPR